MRETNMIGTYGHRSSGRNGARVRLWALHTEEGNSNARGLANYFLRAEVSYHYTIDNAECIDVVDTDRAAWAALSANPYTIHLCFAGSKASQSRSVWLDKYGAAIDYAAFLAVQDARKYGTQVRTINHAEIRSGQSGITDHYGITKGLGIGTHTDVGPNFPWDVFAAAVNKHATGKPAPAPAPTPVVNAIDAQAKVTPWLGARKSAEQSTPDGRGKFAAFEHGHIYWTPETGARPIPTHLFETYAALGYETGPLGYPVAFHTVLPGGDVQAFEKGVLYRKYGQPGFFVTGLIGARWARSGYENGPFGWPVSNETPLGDGSVVQDFEHGRMFWSPDGTVAMKPTDGPDTIVPDEH